MSKRLNNIEKIKIKIINCESTTKINYFNLSRCLYCLFASIVFAGLRSYLRLSLARFRSSSSSGV